MDRVYEGFALQNMRDAVMRIKQWLRNPTKVNLSEHDLTLLSKIQKANEELHPPAPPQPQMSSGWDELNAELSDA